jgi:glutamine cyclotransferase
MRIILFFFVAISVACGNGPDKPRSNAAVTPSPKSSAATYTYEIVKSYPHDADSFTQGLVIHNGFFYESDGEYDTSSLRKVEIETGKVVRKYDVPREYFAEGLTILNDRIYQITWQEFTGFVYDMDFKLQREFRYSGQGWGLTNDGTNLIMSDGTHVIRVIEPEKFETVKTIVVKDDGRPVYKLNELEWVKGEIWANVWHSENIGKPNHIARIDPATGNVTGWIDLQGISPEDTEGNSEKTLNGIAYDAAADRIFVTGKLWKKLFEIRVKPKG